MDAGAFLTSVLPDEGYLIVATPVPTADRKGSWWKNVVVSDIPQALAQCAEWVWEGNDVYFALASYEKPKVWNAKKVNKKTGEIGGWERRTQANAKYLRSLFLDLDVKPGKEGNYQSQLEAVSALRVFCREVGLVKPMLVNSGFGVHAYWPLETSVPRDTWRTVAEKLKSCSIACGLKADHNVTADAARVLRPIGSFNFKSPPARPVDLLCDSTSFYLSTIDGALTRYITENNLSVVAVKPRLPPMASSALAGIEGNLGATNNPLSADLLALQCPAFAKQLNDRGASATEPQWYNAVGLAKFCEPQREALLAVSDGYPAFSESGMQEKLANWTQPPPTCATIWRTDNDTCENCRNWRKINSPAAVGRAIREAPLVIIAPAPQEIEVIIPKPPRPYVRSPDGPHGEIVVAIISGDSENNMVKETICPYDFYPRRIMRQRVGDDAVEESSVWVANLSRIGEVEIKLPQSILSDTRKLHALLLSNGMHIHAGEAKMIQTYMSAYMKELARVNDREKMYERLGWHEKYRCFVMPNMIYHRDGTMQKHTPNATIRAVTKEGLIAEGAAERSHDAMLFYSGDGNQGQRFMLGASLGAFLFHMTGYKGVLLTASGDTGRGKTTLLEAGASLWGNPESLLVGGGQYGSTLNALWSMLGTNHSLPFFWDDTTERNPDEMRDFMLHISQGKGKERMFGNTHDGKVVTWETMVLSSANTDDVHRVMTTGKDVAPHLMRMISIEFDSVDRSTEAKLRADRFRREIRENFGHAGLVLMMYVVRNYDKVKELVIRESERVDNLLKFESQERYVGAAIACALVASRMARRLGVFPFDLYTDIDWIKAHVSRMRVERTQASSSPVEILDTYLNERVTNTLTVSPKAASNLDNIVSRPYGALLVRNEIDTGLIYVAREAFNRYCTESKANFRKIEADLQGLGVITRLNCHKVLGADTPLAMGQTRCWEISMAKLQAFTRGGRQ